MQNIFQQVGAAPDAPELYGLGRVPRTPEEAARIANRRARNRRARAARRKNRLARQR